MKLLSVVALFGFLGVVFGAFGAHAIADTVSPERLIVYKTGVLYHLLHTVAALGVVLLALRFPLWKQLSKVIYLFLMGIVVFSGSLYSLVIFDVPMLGAVTPIGGTLLLAGWALLAIYAWGVNHD